MIAKQGVFRHAGKLSLIPLHATRQRFEFCYAKIPGDAAPLHVIDLGNLIATGAKPFNDMSQNLVQLRVGELAGYPVSKKLDDVAIRLTERRIGRCPSAKPSIQI